MEDFKGNKITVTNFNGEELSLTISDDADIYEWEKTLRIILKWVTFSDQLIDEILGKDENG